MTTTPPTAKSATSTAELAIPPPARLPAYTRSLLRIEVPVVVTLAANQHSIRRILELGPGTLLHFNKPCDEPLSLLIGQCQVAVGEAVKVGEKFGLRITSMVLPEEKFAPVRGKSTEPLA